MGWKMQRILLILCILSIPSYLLAEESKTSWSSLDKIQATSLKLQDTYSGMDNSPIPATLEAFYSSLLRTMLLDPDRGDPLEGQKAEPAWKLTEDLQKEWQSILPQLKLCEESQPSLNDFTSVVGQILEHRRRLQYRAARSLVRNGELKLSYTALTDSFRKCTQTGKDEDALIQETQRRYRFEQLGLALDEFFNQYAKDFPQDESLTEQIKDKIANRLIEDKNDGENLPKSLSAKALTNPDYTGIANSEAKARSKQSSHLDKISPWLLGFGLANCVLLLLMFRELKGIRHTYSRKETQDIIGKKAKENAEANASSSSPLLVAREQKREASLDQTPKEKSTHHEAEINDRSTLYRMQIDFRRIVNSDEFYERLLEEINTLEEIEKQTYIKDLTLKIEEIQHLLSSERSIEEVASHLSSIVAEIKDQESPHHFTALEGVLSFIIDYCEPKDLMRTA